MSKLIRDGYQEIIPKEKWEKVSDAEALVYAIDKIDEELLELRESNFEDIYEYADLIEVIYTVARLKGFDQKQIAKAIYKKNTDKGMFFENIILED